MRMFSVDITTVEKERHFHKDLKFRRKFRKEFLEVASGYGLNDGCRNTLTKCGGSIQLHKKEQISTFSILAKAGWLKLHLLI